MSKTVVGFFSNIAAAQEAKEELVDSGYSTGDIRVMANNEANASTSSETQTEGGFAATISHFFRSLTGGEQDESHYQAGLAKGGALLSVNVADGREAEVAKLLKQYGADDVEDSNVAKTGNKPSTLAAGASAGTAIPVVQEELVVGKQQVQYGGIRVYSHLVETPVAENIQLQEERVHIHREAVNRPATEADFKAFKEGTLELTETAEEAVVTKKARVVEEIVVGKETTQRTQTVHDTVRHTEVEIEELEPELEKNLRKQ